MSEARRRWYLRAAADFWRQAIALQSDRCLESDDRGDVRSRADIEFFAVAVHRLLRVAEQARDRISASEPIRDAIAAFEQRWPSVREVRNYSEHLTGPRPRGQMPNWYSHDSIWKGLAGGRVEYLIHARDMQPDIDQLYEALCDFLGEVPEDAE